MLIAIPGNRPAVLSNTRRLNRLVCIVGSLSLLVLLVKLVVLLTPSSRDSLWTVFPGSLWLYVVIYINLLFVVVALVFGRPDPVSRVWMLSIIFATTVSPLVSTYQPALGAAPGYEMQNVTQPRLVQGIVKQIQIVTEQVPCQYTLLGWSENNHLYYQAACGTETLIWRYDPVQTIIPQQIQESAVPALSQEQVTSPDVLNMVRAYSVRPKKVEPWVREINLVRNPAGYVSPDGRWMAIISRYVYGPQDVLILTPSG